MKAVRTSAQSLDWAIYSRDAHQFIFGQDGEQVLWTKDEHDQDNAEKPFPDYPYLRCLLDCLLVSGRWIPPEECIYALEWGIPLAHLQQQALMGMTIWEKSRQIMASWICCAYLLWRAKFHAHQLIIVQSKKEEDAAKFVFVKEAQQARISFMESRLPEWLQDGMFLMPATGAYSAKTRLDNTRRAESGHLWFPNGSHIWAIPQGGNLIRSNTPSCLFSDEAAFQPEFGLAYNAALPALKGGGQGIFISSAEIGDFCNLVEAQV